MHHLVFGQRSAPDTAMGEFTTLPRPPSRLRIDIPPPISSPLTPLASRVRVFFAASIDSKPADLFLQIISAAVLFVARLAYVEAVILELLRYKTLVPLAVSHCTLNDTQLAGYFIPRGTTVS